MRLTKWDRDVARIWIGLIGAVEQIRALRGQGWTKRDAYQGQFTTSDGGSFDDIPREH